MMRAAIPTDLLMRLANASPEQYAAVERALGAKAETLKPETLKPEGPDRTGRQQKIIHTIGRLEYREGFKDVWLGKEHFDLRGRTQARLCLEYLVAKQALTENSARHFADEIDPYVREKGGNCGRGKFSEIKIKQYFNDRKGRLPRLRSDLIRTVEGSGKYYLET